MNSRRMKLQRLSWLLLISIVLAVTSGRAMQRVEQHHFILGDQGTVRLNTYRGLVNVVAGEGPGVEVSVRSISGETSEEAARRALDGLRLTMEARDGNVMITAANPSETGVRIDLCEPKKLEVYIDLVVPARCSLEISNDDGSINVGDLTGECVATAQTGTIFFRHINGDIMAETNFGDIIVSRCSGSVDLKSRQGNLQVGTVSGRARLETVEGDIEIMNAQNSVMAQSATGDVSAQFARITAASRLRTDVGSVTTIINPAESFSLNVRSRRGKTNSDFKLDATHSAASRNRLMGDYRGGGPQLEIDAPGGAVRIKPGEPLFEG